MEAYAKLVGRVGTESEDDASKREFLVKALPCYLGRALSKESGCIVVDSTDTLLSRQHVQIAWTPKNGWKLVCLSKNGCTVDKKKYEKDGVASLVNGSAIRLGNARLYFTLPIIEPEVPNIGSNNRKRERTGTTLTDEDNDDERIILDKGTSSGNGNVGGNGSGSGSVGVRDDNRNIGTGTPSSAGRLKGDRTPSLLTLLCITT